MTKVQLPQETNSVAQEMKDYFSSIEDLFRKSLRDSHSERPTELGLILLIVTTAFSVFPIVPLVVWALIRWLLPHWQFAIHGWPIPVHSFLFWWAACVTVFLPLAIATNVLDTRLAKRHTEDLLNPPPMRFALCHAIVQEIDRYTKNRLPKHLENAMNYWNRLMPMLRDLLDPLGTC
jgi:hypothetical protein